jgi:phage tail-like protein
VFASDPDADRIWRIDGCSGEAFPLLPGGPGSDIGQLTQPRGLAAGPGPIGWRLYIADSGNRRVQVMDARSQQILTTWASPLVRTPIAVAAGQAGAVYVVDADTLAVHRYRADGQVDATFWQTLSARQDRPAAPQRVVVVSDQGKDRIVILDGSRVVFADTTGAPAAGGSWPFSLASPAIALAATADAVYIGCVDGTLVRFTPAGEQRSSLTVGTGLTALALGCRANQLVASTGALPLTMLDTGGGFLTGGSLRAGPFTIRARPYEWQRLRVDAEVASASSHLQLFTHVSADATPPPATFDPAAWTPSPADELDVLLLGPEVRQVLMQGPPADPQADQDPGPLRDLHIWIGARLSGDGTSSPVVHQMRLDWSPPAYLEHLPATYREGARRPLLLGLMLSLLGSEIDRVDGVLDGLAALFDVASAPADWLPWLAGWLDFTPASGWSTAELRSRLMQAIDLYPWRGTPEGMKRYVEMYAGVHALIEEPAAAIALFRLDDDIALGFTTVLGPEYEQGAVLASTAVLGQSSVLNAQDVGAPLFSDIVHRFSVRVYGAEIDTPATLAAVQRVVDAEKPAHTVAHVCVIEPSMRIGFQARIGIDTIVAGPPPDLRVGAVGELGVDAIVANQPRRGNRLGQGARVGATL